VRTVQETDFQKAGDSIMDRMKEINTKMDGLEQSISGLMYDAGLDENGNHNHNHNDNDNDNHIDNDNDNGNGNDKEDHQNYIFHQPPATQSSPRRAPTNASPSRKTTDAV